MEIKFGTAGWRAVISDGFTFKNVQLVTQAIADYLLSHGEAKKPVIVGYDTRFESEEFAEASAKILCSNKIRVLLTNRDTPTPVVAYHILKKKASGGINITASHNPPEYNGIKFSPSYGGPAHPEVTSWIEGRIKEMVDSGWQMAKRPREDYIEVFDPRPEYLSHIKSLIDISAIRKAKLKAFVDCMFGTSRGYLDEVLRNAGWEVKTLNEELNPLFGGRSPEPSIPNLDELISEVRNSNASLGLATDGDGDRFGIIDADGTYIAPNQVIVLALEHLASSRADHGTKVARTVATTHMVDAVARQKGLEVVETPVGFKYIGPELAKGDCLIGGEESGGLSIMGHIPEKDGILACLLVTEMVAVRRQMIGGILEELWRRVGRFYSKRVDFRLKGGPEKELLRELEIHPPKQIGGTEVISVNKLDGYKFILRDNSWVLFRPSGTEPLMRCYLEARSKWRLEKIAKAVDNILKFQSVD